jgi:hypothetical protein
MQKTIDRYCIEGKNSAVAETTVQKMEENAADCRNSIEGRNAADGGNSTGGNKVADGRTREDRKQCSKW